MTRSCADTDAILVSIGIPTYNRPDGLRRTLNCLLEQSHRHLEIIVSDNASTDDGVRQVCREFAGRDARVRVFHQPVGLGIVMNFRFVLMQASGDCFMWAADDDEWDPRFVEVCLAKLRQGAVTAMTTSTLYLRHQGKRAVQSAPRLELGMSRYAAVAAFLLRPYPNMIYGLHRRQDLLDCIDEPPWFDYYDCYLVLKLLLRGPGVVVQEPLFVAGVDAPEYEVKPMASRLRFAPFFDAVTAEFDQAGLRPDERWRLKALALLATIRFALSYWRGRVTATLRSARPRRS
jgi:glycosyltransferase involved in cell wall biosynthesis